MKTIEHYIWQYPQLTLGVKNGTKDTEEYKDIVLRGKMPESLNINLKLSGKEERIQIETPIGKTEALYLPERETFEYFVKVLAYRNEEVDIPKTTGAIFISGLNNWRKIDKHKEEYLKDHSIEEWDEEFARFTANKDNYKDSVLLISKGEYSAVPASMVGYSQDEWLELSKVIRIYHENTHAISRKLYPQHKEAIRDEVLADSIGIYGALGRYDANLVRIVLGLDGEKYRQGARLENYVSSQELPKAIEYAKELIDKLDSFFKNNSGEPFELLLRIEEEYIS